MKKFVKKDRLNKLKLIDDLLQSKVGYTMKEMMEKLEVSSKDTIRTMLGYKNGLKLGIRHGEYWPEYLLEKYDPEKINIITEEKESISGKIRYKYSKEDFSLFKDELEHHVIESLLPILEHLNQMEGLNDLYIDQLFDIYDVLERQRDGKYSERINKIQSKEKIIKSETKKIFTINEDFIDPSFIGTICSAIEEKQVLLIKYTSFKKEISNIICHHYKIVQSDNRWYLICLVNKSVDNENEFTKHKRIGKINCLPTERISSIKIIKNKYLEENIDIFRLLNNTIGISINWEKPEIIKLKIKVKDNLVNYFKTKPLISSGGTNKENIFTYEKTILSFELKNKILSYGSQIEVIEPIKYREEIKKEIQFMKKIYS